MYRFAKPAYLNCVPGVRIPLLPLTFRTVMVRMAKIGKPIRKIDVQPLEEPDPTRVPEPDPLPVETPEREPNVEPAVR